MTVKLLEGSGIAGAAFAIHEGAGIAALFPTGDAPLDSVEVTLPAFPCHTLWIAGLESDRRYDLEFSGSNLASGDAPAPGVPLRSQEIRANQHGIAQISSGASFFPAGSRAMLRAL